VFCSQQAAKAELLPVLFRNLSGKGGNLKMKNKWIVVSLIIILALSLGVTPAAANGSGMITNGSFETGDYSGWTLLEDSSYPDNGTWGIATTGQIIKPGDSTYDFFDKIMVQQYSEGLPITYNPTDGHYLAYQLQNGEENHRMYQDITLSQWTKTISWDMWYHNWDGDFDPAEQCLAVRIRDLSDNILKTLFITAAGTSPQSIPMTGFTGDISAYAGATVRLDIEMIVHNFHFDAAFDNFKLNSIPIPGISQWSITATAVLFAGAIVWVGWRRLEMKKTHWKSMHQSN
jgi:hypothetical protein